MACDKLMCWHGSLSCFQKMEVKEILCAKTSKLFERRFKTVQLCFICSFSFLLLKIYYLVFHLHNVSKKAQNSTNKIIQPKL